CLAAGLVRAAIAKSDSQDVPGVANDPMRRAEDANELLVVCSQEFSRFSALALRDQAFTEIHHDLRIAIRALMSATFEQRQRLTKETFSVCILAAQMMQ